MQLILELLLQWTENPLIALIGVSVAVSVGSLPFYHIAEKWQESERLTQKKLKPKLDIFKQIFSGATLNAYVGTLYRQHRYHPIYAVRTSAGLLMQIPFFFAAYHLLSHYQPFIGLSSGIFNDLGKGDGLLTVAGFSINALPFIMTVINLVSASIYGKKTVAKEKVQLYGISLFFLVVLYNSPAALLFYWTMNNLFSLFKNIGYTLIYKKGEILSKKQSVRVRPPARFAHRTALFFASLSSLLLLIFIANPLSLLASGSINDFEEPLFFYLSFSIASLSFLFFTLATLFSYLPPKIKEFSTLLFSFLTITAAINTFLLAGNYGDMSSFIFDTTFSHSTIDLLTTILIAIATVALLWLLVFKLQRSDILLSFLVIYLLSLIAFSTQQTMLFTQKRTKNERHHTTSHHKKEFVFSKQHKNVIVVMLDRFMGGYIPQLLELIPELKEEFDGFVWYSHMLSPGSHTISGEPPIMGGWDYYVRTVNHTRTDVPLKTKLDESIRIMPYNFKKAGFHVSLYAKLSRWWNKKDKTHLEDVRIADLPKKYQKIWMNEHNKTIKDTFVQKQLALFGLFRSTPPFWRSALYDGGSWNLADGDESSRKKKNTSTSSVTEKKKNTSTSSVTEKKKNTSTSSVTEKKKKKKDPLFVSFRERSKSRILRSIKYWSVLDYLPRISKAEEEAPSQFYYMTNDLPHEPFATNQHFEIQPEGKIQYPRAMYNKFAKSLNALKHLYTDGATLKLLARWLTWMKRNGVYDNTRIIFVSDHGRTIHDPAFGKKQKIPGSKRRTWGALFHNLLLVKDFNARGELKENSSDLMSNGDVPALALDGIISGINPYTGNALTVRGITFPFFVYHTQWRMGKQGKYKYNIKNGIKITKEPIFNLKNWKSMKKSDW